MKHGESGRSDLRKKLSNLRSGLSQAVNVALERYYGDMLSLRAMSLTYSSLLAMVPFLAVTFSVLKAFGIQTRIGPLLAQALLPLGPDRFEITRRVVQFVDNTQVGVLGAVGIAGLLYTVISLVSNVEDSLNRIWRARPASSWTRRYRDYLGILLVGPVFVFAGLALIASAQSTWVIKRLLEIQAFGNFWAFVTQIMPFFFLCAGFAFLYKFVPATYVRLRSAVLGGAVAGILWHVAGLGFAAFVAGSTRYDAIYSGFAILIVFLFWLYLAWLIVLIGAEVAYLYQYSYLWSENLLEDMHRPIFQEWLALSTLVEITRSFLAGEPPRRETELSSRLGVPSSNLGPVVDKLVDSGILLRTAQPEGISLARPPGQIPVTDILDIINGRLESSVEKRNSVVPVLQRRDRAVRQKLEEITLSSLASEPPSGVAKLLKTSSGSQ